MFSKMILLAITCLIAGSCKKPAGPGGKATITGKVYAKNFDSYGFSVLSEYYIPGESVYICYGTDNTVRNNVKTSTDGSFKFLYLNKGHYKVFAVSRDTSVHSKGSKKTIPVEFEFDINGLNDTKDLGTITINK